MLTAMNKTLELFKKDAEQIRFNYNRMTKDKKIAWGNINAK
jgi:cation transport regulator ChaB